MTTNEIINRVKSNNSLITLYDGSMLAVCSPDVIHHGTPFWDIQQNEPATLERAEQLNENDTWETVSFIDPEKTTLETWVRRMVDADGNLWELTLTIETENDNDTTEYVYSADWSDAECEIIENNTDYIGYNVNNGRNIIESTENIMNDIAGDEFELTVDDYVVAENDELRTWADFDLLENLAESENPLETLGNHIRHIIVNSYDPADYDDDDPAKTLIADNAGIWCVRINNQLIRL